MRELAQPPECEDWQNLACRGAISNAEKCLPRVRLPRLNTHGLISSLR